MAAGVYKAEGIVLRRRPLGEADEVIGFLSPTRGRFDAVARGVHNSKRAASGRLEPFTHVRLLVAHGRSLDIISQTKVVRVRSGLLGDLDRLARGLYILELYERNTEMGTPSGGSGDTRDWDRLFRSLLRALDEIERDVDPDLVCRRAELRLLTVLGCAPQVDVCVLCGRSDGLAVFSAASGGFLCASCQTSCPHSMRRVSGGCRALLSSLRAPQLDEVVRSWQQNEPRIRGEVEGVLIAHLDWHWPHRLCSRRFVDVLRAEPVVP